MLIRIMVKGLLTTCVFLAASSFAIARIPARDAHDAGGNTGQCARQQPDWEFRRPGCSHKSPLRRPFKGGLLHDPDICAGSYYDSGAFPPRRSRGNGRLWRVALWHGNHFDAKSLKTLPPGSLYSEPGGDNHFAQTETDPVIVQICGYGPTDTRYFEPANDPRSQVREKK